MPPFKKLKTVESSSEDRRRVLKTSTDSDSEGADWREECLGIRDINSYALRKNILTDVTFFVGDEKKIFHAHRLILALASPVFEAMFYGPLAEKNDTITIPDVDPEGFRYVLEYLYTEFAPFRDDVAAFKTAFAADKYCISYLKERCERFLCRAKITASNVWVFLQNSIYLNMNNIRIMCFDYLSYNTEAALKHITFLDMTARTIETLLQHNSFYVCEKILLESLIQWARHNSSAEDKNSFKNLIMPLLRYIRFRALQAAEFVFILEVRKLKEVLKNDDALAILKHIVQPNLCALPAWCYITSSQIRTPPIKNCSSSRDIKRAFTVRCLLSRSNSDDAENKSSSQSTSSSSSESTESCSDISE